MKLGYPLAVTPPKLDIWSGSELSGCNQAPAKPPFPALVSEGASLRSIEFPGLAGIDAMLTKLTKTEKLRANQNWHGGIDVTTDLFEREFMEYSGRSLRPYPAAIKPTRILRSGKIQG